MLLFQGELNGSVFCIDNVEKTEIQKALASTKKVPLFNHKIAMMTCMTRFSFEIIKPTVSNWRINENKVYWLPWYCAREIEVQ